MTVFVSMAAGLLVLWYNAERNDGLYLVTSNHYTWTYGPTALLVFIVAAWRQIDYNSKSLLPWAVLKEGNAPATKSILLDYISPLQIVSLGYAIKNLHTSVVATILGFILLKTITLASTALLDLQTLMIIAPNSVMASNNHFDGTLYNETAFISGSDSSLVYNAYGISTYGVAFPDGLQNGMAYESFHWPEATNRKNVTTSAIVTTFVPHFNCEVAQVLINPISTGTNNLNATMKIVAPACEIAGGSQPQFFHDPTTLNTTFCPTRQTRGVMQRIDCSNGTSASGAPNLQLLTLVQVDYQQAFDGQNLTTNTAGEAVNVTSWTASIKQVKSIVCRPSYGVAQFNVSYDLSQSIPSVELRSIELGNRTGSYYPNGTAIRTSKLQNFTDENLALMFSAAMIDAADMFGKPSNDEFADDFPNTMFKLMAARFGGTYETLFGEDGSVGGVMAAAAEGVFADIAAQIANKYLRKSGSFPLTGKAQYTEDRLQISNFSFGVMITGCAVMAGFCLIIWFSRPVNVVLSNPDSIVGLAQVIAESEDFVALTEGSHARNDSELTKQLTSHNFSTSVCELQGAGSAKMRINALLEISEDKHPPTDLSSHSRASVLKWWKPLMVQRPMLLLTLCLPLVAIAVLEVVQQITMRGGGLALSQSSSNTPDRTLYIRYVPALSMLLIATMFNSLDFIIAVITPFSTMKARNVVIGRGFDGSLLGELPHLALLKSLRQRQWAAASSTVASLLGSILTVVVSGLYTIDLVTQPLFLHLPQAEIFNVTRTGANPDDGTAAVLTSLLEGSNLSYPAQTYYELAFAALPSDSKSALHGFAGDKIISVEVPALRAALECTTLGPETVNVSVSYNSRILSPNVRVDARTSLPSTCLFGGSGGNLSFIDFSWSTELPANNSYVGKLLDLHVGPYLPIQDDSADELSVTQPDNPPGCPSVSFIYGYADVNDQSKTSITTLVCTQHIQQLQTSTNMTIKQVILNTTILDEITATNLSASTTDTTLTAFPFRIQLPIDQSLSLFNQTVFPSANTAQTPVDAFFQGALLGKTPLSSLAALAAPSTDAVAHGQVFDAIQAFYRRYMAQVISLNMRRPYPDPNATDAALQTNNVTYNATILDATPQARLVQHRASAITLQVLLGCMFALGLGAVLGSDFREVVPRNPCTIFGRAALLAGARLGRESRDRSGDTEMDLQLRLGWWERERLVREDGKAADQKRRDWERRVERYGIDIVDEAE